MGIQKESGLRRTVATSSKLMHYYGGFKCESMYLFVYLYNTYNIKNRISRWSICNIIYIVNCIYIIYIPIHQHMQQLQKIINGNQNKKTGDFVYGSCQTNTYLENVFCAPKHFLHYVRLLDV